MFVALEKTPGASWLNLAANGCMPANGLANAEKFIISTLVYSAKQNKFLLLSKVSFCAHFVWFKINFIKRQLKSEPCVLSGWKKKHKRLLDLHGRKTVLVWVCTIRFSTQRGSKRKPIMFCVSSAYATYKDFQRMLYIDVGISWMCVLWYDIVMACTRLLYKDVWILLYSVMSENMTTHTNTMPCSHLYYIMLTYTTIFTRGWKWISLSHPLLE